MERRKKKNQRPIYVESGLIKSKAFNSFKRTKSAQILMHFLRKRQWSYQSIGKKKKWVLHNNGKIVFPYSEANELGYSSKQFSESKKELVEHGFIDVNNDGGIFDGDTATCFISERWRKKGTPEFEFKTIPKDTRKDRGWDAVRKKYTPRGLKRMQKGLAAFRRKRGIL